MTLDGRTDEETPLSDFSPISSCDSQELQPASLFASLSSTPLSKLLSDGPAALQTKAAQHGVHGAKDSTCLRVLALVFALLLTSFYFYTSETFRATGGCPPGVVHCMWSPLDRGDSQSRAQSPRVHEFSLKSGIIARLVMPMSGAIPRSGRGQQASLATSSVQEHSLLAPLVEMPPWFQNVTTGRHVADATPARAMRKLMAEIAVNNTIIVVSTNWGFFNTSLNLLCRLHAVGATNVLTWALDKDSAEALKERKFPYYYDNSTFSVSHYTSYFDPEYVRMMVERPGVWWRLLATGFDLLFLDSDVVLFRNPMEVFPRHADIEGQIDGRYWYQVADPAHMPDMCAGAFWLRSSEMTLRLLDQMRDDIESSALKKRCDDQIALNAIIRNPEMAVVLNRGPLAGKPVPPDEVQGKLRVAFVEPTDIMGGRLEKMSKRIEDPNDPFNVTFLFRNSKGQERLVRPAIFHLNGRGVEYIKLKMLHKAHWWEVKPNGHCRKRWVKQPPVQAPAQENPPKMSTGTTTTNSTTSNSNSSSSTPNSSSSTPNSRNSSTSNSNTTNSSGSSGSGMVQAPAETHQKQHQKDLTMHQAHHIPAEAIAGTSSTTSSATGTSRAAAPSHGDQKPGR